MRKLRSDRALHEIDSTMKNGQSFNLAANSELNINQSQQPKCGKGKQSIRHRIRRAHYSFIQCHCHRAGHCESV